MVERHQLVQDAAETPDIRFLVVHFVLPDLGSHNTRRADLSLRHLKRSPHILGNPKIPNLQLIKPPNKNILTFQIPMHYLPIMHILQPMTQLNKPFQNLLLAQQTIIIPIFPSIQIAFKLAILGVLHDNADIAFVVLEALGVVDHVLMA